MPPKRELWELLRFMVSAEGNENMENKTNFGEEGQPGVNLAPGDDLREVPFNEAPRALADTSEPGEANSPLLQAVDGLPARRIELRYWVALLATGLAIWAAIIFWLL
jgi:hypothetical protein